MMYLSICIQKHQRGSILRLVCQQVWTW